MQAAIYVLSTLLLLILYSSIIDLVDTTSLLKYHRIAYYTLILRRMKLAHGHTLMNTIIVMLYSCARIGFILQ